MGQYTVPILEMLIQSWRNFLTFKVTQQISGRDEERDKLSLSESQAYILHTRLPMLTAAASSAAFALGP